jgi:mRNA deadenylase 3'-5' endonuclease subunit Ccr4
MLNCCNRFHKKSLPLQVTQLSNRGGIAMTGSPPQFGNHEWKGDNESFEQIVEFSLVTFNMLAPCYKRIARETSGAGRRERESDRSLMWNQRATDTITFFEKELLPSSSILALQEFWLNEEYSSMFEKFFDERGYDFRTLKRSGSKTDAVAIAVRKDEFEIMGSEDLYLCPVGDRVALLLWLRHKRTGKNIIVANTHLSFPHNAFDRMNQMRQMRKLTDAIDRYCKNNKVGSSTRIVTGDFNSEVRSSVCDHLRSSGYQSTFEKCPPMQRGSLDHNLDMDADSQQHLESDICRSVDGTDISTYSFSESLGSPLQATSDCPIRRRSSEEGTNSQSLQKFVSHRTHTNEDLGVDHIFVKPEEPMSLQEAQNTINDMAKMETISRSRPSFEEKKQNEEVYAEMESDMDGIDTMRKFTEEVIADTRAYRSEEEERKRNRILLLARSEEHEEEKAQDREFSVMHSVPAESTGRGPSKDILMSTAALSTQLQLTASTFLFFANSRVIPTSIPLDVWSTAFLLSDHRPVSSSIILAKLSSVKN